MSTYGISTGDAVGHSNISLKDRVRGTLIGGAIGDAFGDPLEFIPGREVVNNSKGCGGVMRVAPGIHGATRQWSLAETASLARVIAELTHSNPMSTYASVALAVIVQQCLCSGHIDREVFKTIVAQSLKTVGELYGESDHLMTLFKKAIEDAVRLSEVRKKGWPDKDIMELCIGAGWTAEETLAIAVFCVLRHFDDFEGCLVCAVNHEGDRDSTGAVTGNILGAIAGYDAIPQKLTVPLQLRSLMFDIADVMM